MWPYHPELLARPVPRYTSYPTAAEFQPAVGATEQLALLAAIPDGTPVSLYVHIPFCHDICWYCGCNTHRANRSARLDGYLEALSHEIDGLARRLSGRVALRRISFGGGSPNALSELAFARLVDQIVTRFQATEADLSVEIDPRTLDAGWAATLGKLGATRASLGVQTLAPHVMQAIGRVQPAAMIARAADLLRRAGVTSLNFDLMYGLPQQEMHDLAETLDAALAIGPDRIALFGYAHVPALIPRQRRIDAGALPDAELRFRMNAAGHQRLLSAGMQAVGFDHFARPSDPLAVAANSGTLRRNFQGFTDDPACWLLGAGATAITSAPDRIVQNEKNPGRYRMRAMAGLPAGERGVLLGAADRARAAVIADLLCGRPAQLDCVPLPAERLHPFLERGLAALDGETLRLTADGLPYARAIAACFDSYRSASGGQFSSAV